MSNTSETPDWNQLMPEVERINNLESYSAIHIDKSHTFLHLPKPHEMQDWKHEDYGGTIHTVYMAIIAYHEYANTLPFPEK